MTFIYLNCIILKHPVLKAKLCYHRLTAFFSAKTGLRKEGRTQVKHSVLKVKLWWHRLAAFFSAKTGLREAGQKQVVIQ